MKTRMFIALVAAIAVTAPGLCAEQLALSGKVENGTRVIEVKASQYKFAPDPIVVKKGEHVKLIITATDVAHGFALDQFKVNASVTPGTPAVAEFTADKEGEYTEECSVYCGPGHEMMKGKFIVEP